MNREQIELIKTTICRGASDDELRLFLATADRLGLDPFARQIFAVKRWDNKDKREVMAIQVSIDGFRSIAARTGEYDGQGAAMWCGDDGEWCEAWLHDHPPAAAKVSVYRRGSSHAFVGVATYRSYLQTNKEGKPNSMWARFPDVMLAKCAEAVALRKAFPSELSGVHTDDEAATEMPPTIEALASLPSQVQRLELAPASADEIGITMSAIRDAETLADLQAIAAAIKTMNPSDNDRAALLGAYNSRKRELGQ